ILLLGETGVGKSTFINSFANYLTYDTLEQAVNGDPVCLIPTQFVMTDENYVEQLCNYGQVDENESCNLDGQSVTQDCQTYCFAYDCHTIRLIDTPGVGDTRGLDQDKVNFDRILRFIAQYDVLHLICILMRPNMTRLTTGFEYCLRQLLCHLQKDASKNMVFLFTNSRTTNYRPGHTLVLLRQMMAKIREQPPNVDITLNKHTMYCLDNDSFQCLIGQRNGLVFNEMEKHTYAMSWDNSVHECNRLINYVSNGSTGIAPLVPHKIQDTLSINDTRRMILALTEPAFIITNTIEKNMVVLERVQLEIRNYQGNINELHRELNMMGYRQQISILKPIYLMFRSQYEHSQDSILDHLLRLNTEKKGKEALIRQYDTRLHDNKYEQEAILKSVAKFALFLSQNAITVSNDPFEVYIEEQLDKARINYTKNNNNNNNNDNNVDGKQEIRNLDNILKQYRREKSILDSYIKMGNVDVRTITIDYVKGLIEDLYGLKETGSLIKQLHRQSITKLSKQCRRESLYEIHGDTPRSFFRLLKYH
ncbi:uncharacterized protein LOC128951621, partial [Oppia nitens]|uniref:uncharacterized protein LOC128951621 n=1 Tax=Oppia nitens TaxID=1686743 RepID=UPI0023D9BEEF